MAWAAVDAGERRERVLRAFLGADGRLVQIPARRGERLVVLDHLASAVEPGRRLLGRTGCT